MLGMRFLSSASHAIPLSGAGSLTEAFCIAILEAASAGLLVVFFLCRFLPSIVDFVSMCSIPCLLARTRPVFSSFKLQSHVCHKRSFGSLRLLAPGSQVSTKVGGVPEVMPSNMIKYARPDPKDLVDALTVPNDLPACLPTYLPNLVPLLAESSN